MLLVIPIALVAAFVLCRTAYVKSHNVAMAWRLIYVALYAWVVGAWTMAAYFHVGPYAVTLLVGGVIGILLIAVMTAAFRIDL
jgi:hypothetical protein